MTDSRPPRPSRPLKVTSAQNETYKDLLELLSAKGIKKQGRFLVFGEKVVRESLAEQPACAQVLITREGDETELPAPLNLRRLELAKELFEELDVFGTHAPILVAATPEIPAWTPSTPPRGLEVICALSDPANLGALIRTAAAFDVSRIVLLAEAASPFHPKAVRAAAGATTKMAFARGPSIRDLNDFGGVAAKASTSEKTEAPAPTANVIGLDMQGPPLTGFKWPRDTYLLLGEEGRGLPDKMRLRLVSIPMRADVESLNATVSASIALYSYRQAYPLA